MYIQTILTSQKLLNQLTRSAIYLKHLNQMKKLPKSLLQVEDFVKSNLEEYKEN